MTLINIKKLVKTCQVNYYNSYLCLGQVSKRVTIPKKMVKAEYSDIMDCDICYKKSVKHKIVCGKCCNSVCFACWVLIDLCPFCRNGEDFTTELFKSKGNLVLFQLVCPYDDVLEEIKDISPYLQTINDILNAVANCELRFKYYPVNKHEFMGIITQLRAECYHQLRGLDASKNKFLSKKLHSTMETCNRIINNFLSSLS